MDMDHSLKSDQQLLEAWVGHRSEVMFEVLVGRYANLVHMAAKRVCGDDGLAADASQLVFILLARKASGLVGHPALAGWLHLAAVRTTRDLMDKNRREVRKRERFQSSAERESESVEGAWRDLEPVLDDGLAALSEKDREAVLLRFYRGLSVKEVGVVTGIAPAAAQKRIDRALERLRGVLARRGCRVGGLAVVLVSGFAADAQAMVPKASLLAGKAVEAVGSGMGEALAGGSSVLTKGSARMLPAAAVVVGGIWLAIQFETIAELESGRERVGVERQAGSGVGPGGERLELVPTALDAQPVDWAEVVRQLKESRRTQPVNPKARLEMGIAEMDLKRVESSLDEIAAAGLVAEDQELLERRFCEELGGPKGGPRLVLERFVGEFDEGSWKWTLGEYFSQWMREDPGSAIDWLAEHVDGMGSLEFGFLDVSLHPLLENSPETAGRLLEVIPPERRLESLRSLENDEFSDAQQIAWAEMVRRHLPEKERLSAIGWPIMNWSDGDGQPMDLPEVSEYLERIGASEAEREACVMLAAEERMAIGGLTGRDLIDSAAAFREWVEGIDSDLVDRATGILFSARMEISGEAVDHLMRYHDESGNDDLLIPFLENMNAENHQARFALRLVEKLRDDGLRQRYLEKFNPNEN